jgi:hypothetical protein
MERIKNAQACDARRVQNLQHVRNTVVRFGDALDASPELATLGNEVVVGIDHQKGSDILVVRESRHAVSSNV